MKSQLEVDGLTVELVRKPMRTLRVSVHMPDGRVRVAAPLRTSEVSIREFVTSRLAWIRKHQAAFRSRPAVPVLAYVPGETHYYQGRPYQLRVTERPGRARVELLPATGVLALAVPPGTSAAGRALALAAWYRARLKEQVPALLAKWQPVVGAEASAWGIKQMRTRWGTCSIRARRIWLSLELAKRPVPCLEYVVVHELVHLHERLHNARFWALLSAALPEWPALRQQLNQGLLPGQPADAD